jgi:hypothetical protein
MNRFLEESGWKLFVCIFLFAFLAILNTSSLQAETTEESIRFVDALESRMAQLKSLSCRVHMFLQAAHEPSIFLEWSENSVSYRYSYREVDAEGKEVFWSSESSGPDGSMDSLERGALLAISKTPRVVPRSVRNVPLPSALLEFAYNRLPADVWETPSIGALKQPDTWRNLLGQTKFLGSEELKGKKVMVFEITGGRDRFIGMPVNYRVYVDFSDGYRPVAWKTFNKDNRLISEYEVLKFAGNAASPELDDFFPSEAKITYYAPSESDIRSEPSAWQRLKYENVTVNDFGETDAITLDPAAANVIYDQDAEVLIPVPK